jgi:hypothetical protein
MTKLRRFFSRLLIVLSILTIVLFVLLFIREQRYLQIYPDYTQYASEDDLQAYLDQQLQVGTTTKDEVEAYIMQSGMGSKIGSYSQQGRDQCWRGETDVDAIVCEVRAPINDFSNESWGFQLFNNLMFEYYFIDFEFEDGILKEVRAFFEDSFV